jgi:hypothetical protein
MQLESNRAQAVGCAAFLANGLAIGKKRRFAFHPDPAALGFAEVLHKVPNKLRLSEYEITGEL